MGNTQDEIKERMLSKIPDSFDKTEGSFFFDAIMPMAIELAQAYLDIDVAITQTFINTATGDYLSRGTAQMGVTRFPASAAIGQAVLTGSPETSIPSGTLLATNRGTRFVTTAEVIIGADSMVNAPIQAVVPGIAGNVTPGNITVIPVSVPGLASVTNTAATYGGEDEETDEALRARYFTEISQRAQDGNIAQYYKWAAGFTGIGRAKVFPLWNGANTVKVSILNSNNIVASPGLMQAFQEYLDPDSTGLGNGAAPIGAIVTVTTATAININIALEVELTAGFTEPTGVEEAVAKYFADIAYVKNTVSYLSIAGKILDVPSVERLQSLSVNSSTVDISLGVEKIPTLGSFTCQVVTP